MTDLMKHLIEAQKLLNDSCALEPHHIMNQREFNNQMVKRLFPLPQWVAYVEERGIKVSHDLKNKLIFKKPERK